MNLASTSPEDDDRAFSRVAVNIPGRMMRADKMEYDCVVANMSPGDALISTGTQPAVGERIVAYLEQIGRIEGKVARQQGEGFVLNLNATERKREKLAAQLTWIANKHELSRPEDRRHERVAPRAPNTEIELADGRRYPCRIIDLSLSGAAVDINVRPAFGTAVTLGNMKGRVVRHFQEGIAIEFVTIQPKEALEHFF